MTVRTQTRWLAAIGMAILLTGCAVSWVDEGGRQNHLGLLWLRHDKAAGGEATSVIQTRQLGVSLEAGTACVGVQVGLSDKVRVAHYPDGKYWRVDYDTTQPFLSVIEELSVIPARTGFTGLSDQKVPQ